MTEHSEGAKRPERSQTSSEGPTGGFEARVAAFERTYRAIIGEIEKVIVGHRQVVREVLAAEHVRDYVSRLVLATHPGSEFSPEFTRRYIRYGANPRADGSPGEDGSQ